MKYDCLIVDDERALSESTCEYFTLFGLRAAWVASAAECLTFVSQHEVSLILLDINLGGDSGFELCTRLRTNWAMPIIFISARTSDDDVLLALGIGGDDYVTKPYSLAVLLAKVKAVLKRQQDAAGGVQALGTTEEFDPLVVNPNLIIDPSRMAVTVRGRVMDLKAMECKLLVYLAQNPGRVITKEELFRQVWGDLITSDNTLNVHIRHLRMKIENDPKNPAYIHTVWGVGYRFTGTSS